MDTLKKSVDASTLIDVIVALLIISIVFGIAISTVEDISLKAETSLHQKAWLIAGNELQTIGDCSLGVETTITVENQFVLTKKLIRSTFSTDVYQGILSVKTINGKPLIDRNILIYISNAD